MEYATLAVERHDAVCRISLARESARNAQSQQMLDELDDALSRAEHDDTVRVVVLAGRGAHFSAGHDLKEAQAKRADFTVEERWDYESRRYYGYCLRIWDFPKPTVAQVQGACVAGGFMIANMCDLVVCSDTAYFSDPVGHTLAAAATEVLIHPWVMGLRKAKEMLYTGEKVDAQEALRIGMVNRVVPEAELEAATLALAQRIAQAPPFGLRLIKRSLNRTADAQGFRTALSAHFDTHQLSHLSEEFQAVRERGLAQAIQRNKKGEAA
ncbi:enoyl-CoA hydratase [Achromobacter insolitus]|uniref:enoyl-CoA hydratase n=1 Tax=Achromobacter insolitus TaxID=217204 RepID=UPI00174DA772|nr:enoyl-CoA hydratase [Achromobacter insolitus]